MFQESAAAAAAFADGERAQKRKIAYFCCRGARARS